MMSSHILSELYQVATDYIFIDHGKIIRELTHDALEQEIKTRGEDLERISFLWWMARRVQDEEAALLCAF